MQGQTKPHYQCGLITLHQIGLLVFLLEMVSSFKLALQQDVLKFVHTGRLGALADLVSRVPAQT